MKYVCLPFVLLFLLAGCAGSEDATQRGDAPRRFSRGGGEYVELDLAPAAEGIRTIQLYRGQDARQLPIARLQGGEALTLAFDLMGERGRPLSIFFYHADRTWRRDLSPGEYMASFQQDQLLDYSLSQGTAVPYIHYRYRFPSQNIHFLVSGNYILRVTEQGDEEAVLFERPFFVTESATALEIGLDDLLTGGSAFPAIQPIAAFTPPPALGGSPFDYSTCFMRNGRLDLARCSASPSLARQPSLLFYLEPEMAFTPEAADYYLDLTNLRAGPRIAAADLSVSPFRVALEPDYARFAGTGFDPLLNGQPVVGTGFPGDRNAALNAEYVRVRFRYVPPDEAPVAGEVLVTGSFNHWQYDPANLLEWVPETGRYEGEVLLKQGQYEYRYVTRDLQVAKALASNMPRADNLYTAFVYYDDIRLQTDRLLAVQGVVSQ